MCTQGTSPDEMLGSEDCLYLNLYAPKLPSASETAPLVPVAVFVHGGSYINGASDMFPGDRLVDFWNSLGKGTGIVVTINYRLNVFGFLGAQELRSQDPANGSTGNTGIQDQREAFRWVKKNVKAFGGDPSNVMIFGESAGAGSMANHLTQPNSFGLYSSVILESGSFSQWNSQPLSNAQPTYDALLTASGCSSVACLLSLDEKTLFGLSLTLPQNPNSFYSATGFTPVVDGVELVTHPWLALDGNNDLNTEVNILHGSNTDEGSMFVTVPENATYDDVHEFWVGGKFTDDEIATLNGLYLDGQTYPDIADDITGTDYSVNWWAAQRSLGDSFFSCPAKYTSQKLTPLLEANKKSLFLYHWEHSSVANKGLVPHGSELEFVFHRDDVMFTNNEADKEMSDVMSVLWGNFMSSADPNVAAVGVAVTEWKTYDPGDDNSLNLLQSDDIYEMRGLKDEECSFFNARTDAILRKDFSHVSLNGN